MQVGGVEGWNNKWHYTFLATGMRSHSFYLEDGLEVGSRLPLLKPLAKGKNRGGEIRGSTRPAASLTTIPSAVEESNSRPLGPEHTPIFSSRFTCLRISSSHLGLKQIVVNLFS